MTRGKTTVTRFYRFLIRREHKRSCVCRRCSCQWCRLPFRKMKKWSSRFLKTSTNTIPGKISVLIKKIRKILRYISGNDTISMLRTVLPNKAIEKLHEPQNKYKLALENLADYYNNLDRKKRHFYVRPLRNSGISLPKLRNLGYEICKKSWKSCLNEEERNKGGGVPISTEMQKTILNFLKSESRPAANRLVRLRDTDLEINNTVNVNGKDYVNPRYLEDFLMELYRKFTSTGNAEIYPLARQIKWPTFYNYTKKWGIFKNPAKMSDLCDYCFWANSKYKEITEFLASEENFVPTETFDPDHAINFINKKIERLNESLGEKNKETFKKYQNFNVLLKNYKVVKFHRFVADQQRMAYNNQRKDEFLLREKLLIECDFKEKIRIPMGPQQINAEYYEQEMRTCLGFGISYTCDENRIETINFDIIGNSQDERQDGHSVVRGFRLLRKQTWFKNLLGNRKDYIIWLDCGKHFRCSEVLGYLLVELKEENIRVNVNFFGEKHGKNGRDIHFSCVSRFLEAESHLKRIKSSEDIANAIEQGQLKANNNRINKNLEIIETYALALNEQIVEEIENQHPKKQLLNIFQVESFYNYRTAGVNFDLVTSVLSNKDYVMPLKLKNSNDKDNYRQSYSDVDLDQDERLFDYIEKQFQKLSVKNERVRIGIHMLQNFFNNAEIRENNQNNIQNEIMPAANINPNERYRPEFCFEFDRNAKGRWLLKCKECTNNFCLIEVDRLRNNEASKDEVENELFKHGHPKSKRYANGQQRSIAQARIELLEHYFYSHNVG